MFAVSLKLITNHKISLTYLLIALIHLNALRTIDGVSVAPHVIGGTDAPTNAAPYIVSMQFKDVHYCAASIINEYWAVTAAHCLTVDSQVLATIVIAGSNNVHGTATTVQKRPIDYFVRHDLYLGGPAPYDIGLIHVKTSFQFTVAVKPIALPQNNAIATGDAFLYGWGSTSTTSVDSYPTNLQYAKVPIITLASCESILGATNVHDTNLCTGPLTGGPGICKSDSGGPLTQSKSNTNVLIGIVSWGKMPCGQKNSPSVFVNVSQFVTWIAQHQVVKPM